MLILALDTSTRRGSAAVLDAPDAAPENAVVKSEVVGDVDARHGKTLLPLIDEALETARTTLERVSLIAVGLGPGSFTGTRIGVVSAMAFAVAQPHLKVKGVSSLSAIAQEALTQISDAPERCIVAMDAGRGGLFVAEFERAKGVIRMKTEPFETTPKDLTSAIVLSHDTHLIAGNALSKYAELSDLARPAFLRGAYLELPSATQLALVALNEFVAAGPDDPASLEPTYVRPSDAKLPNQPMRALK